MVSARPSSAAIAAVPEVRQPIPIADGEFRNVLRSRSSSSAIRCFTCASFPCGDATSAVSTLVLAPWESGPAAHVAAPESS
jgi:hypothetical protein